MRSVVRKAALVVSSALVATVGFPTAASAAQPVCGQTITQSTTLAADLGPCPTYGIIIGANNITLDLGGYTIFGTSSPRDGAGVYMLNRTGVVVQNGRITLFDGGVAIEGGSGNTARNLTLEGNIGGSRSLYGDGVAILSSVNNTISRNTIKNNGPFSGVGIYSLIDADHNRITGGVSSGNQILDNTITGNFTPREGSALTGTDNDGIRMENNGTGNVISRNTVSGSGLDGIALFAGSSNNTITFNTVEGNGFYRVTARRGNGIILFNNANGNTVENNMVRGNADNGIVVQGPLGANAGSLNNKIRFNTAVGNSMRPPANPNPGGAFGGPTFDLQDRNVNCDANVWFGNRYRTAFPACTTVGGVQL